MTRQRDLKQRGSTMEPRGRAGQPCCWAQVSRRLRTARAGPQGRERPRGREEGCAAGGGVVTQDSERGNLVVGVLRVELAEVASLIFQARI